MKKSTLPANILREDTLEFRQSKDKNLASYTRSPKIIQRDDTYNDNFVEYVN